MKYQNLIRSIFVLLCMNYVIARPSQEISKSKRGFKTDYKGKGLFKRHFQSGVVGERVHHKTSERRSMDGKSEAQRSEKYYDTEGIESYNSAKWSENELPDLEKLSLKEEDTDIMSLKKRFRRKAKKSSKSKHKSGKSIQNRSSADSSRQASKENHRQKGSKKFKMKSSHIVYERDKSLKVTEHDSSSQKENSQEESRKKQNRDRNDKSYEKGIINTISSKSLKEISLEDSDEAISSRDSSDIESIDDMLKNMMSFGRSKKTSEYSIKGSADKKSKHDTLPQKNHEKKNNEDMFPTARFKDEYSHLNFKEDISRSASEYFDKSSHMNSKKELNEDNTSEEESLDKESTADRSSKTKSKNRSNNDVQQMKKSLKQAFGDISSNVNSREGMHEKITFKENSYKESLGISSTGEKSKERAIIEDGIIIKNSDKSDNEDKSSKSISGKKSSKRKSKSISGKTSSKRKSKSISGKKSSNRKSTNKNIKKYKTKTENLDTKLTASKSNKEHSRKRTKKHKSGKGSSTTYSSKRESIKHKSINADRGNSVKQNSEARLKDDRLTKLKTAEIFHDETFEERSSKTKSYQETSFEKSKGNKPLNTKIKGSKESTKRSSNEHKTPNDNPNIKKKHDKSLKETPMTGSNENKDLSLVTSFSGNSGFQKSQNDRSETLLSEVFTLKSNTEHLSKSNKLNTDGSEKASTDDISEPKGSNGLDKDTGRSQKVASDKDISKVKSSRPMETYDTESNLDDPLLRNSTKSPEPISQKISSAIDTPDLLSQATGSTSMPDQVSIVSQKHLIQTTSVVSESNEYNKQTESPSHQIASQTNPLTQNTVEEIKHSLQIFGTTGFSYEHTKEKTNLASNSKEYLSQTLTSPETDSSTSKQSVGSTTYSGEAIPKTINTDLVSNNLPSIDVNHSQGSLERTLQSQSLTPGTYEHESHKVGSVSESQGYVSLTKEAYSESKTHEPDISSLSPVLHEDASKTKTSMQSKHASLKENTVSLSKEAISSTGISVKTLQEQTVNKMPHSQTSVSKSPIYETRDHTIHATLSRGKTESVPATDENRNEVTNVAPESREYISRQDLSTNTITSKQSKRERFSTETKLKSFSSVINSLTIAPDAREHESQTESLTQVKNERGSHDGNSVLGPPEQVSLIADTTSVSPKQASQSLAVTLSLPEHISDPKNSVESTRHSLTQNTISTSGKLLSNVDGIVEGTPEKITRPDIPLQAVSSASDSLNVNVDETGGNSAHVIPSNLSKGKTESSIATKGYINVKTSLASDSRGYISRQEMQSSTVNATVRNSHGSVTEQMETKLKSVDSVIKSQTFATIAQDSREYALKTENPVSDLVKPEYQKTGSLEESQKYTHLVVDSSPGSQKQTTTTLSLSPRLQESAMQSKSATLTQSTMSHSGEPLASTARSVQDTHQRLSKSQMKSKHATVTQNTMPLAGQTLSSTEISVKSSLERLLIPVSTPQTANPVSDLHGFSQKIKTLSRNVNSMTNSLTAELVSESTIDGRSEHVSQASRFTPGTHERKLPQKGSTIDPHEYAGLTIELSPSSQTHSLHTLGRSPGVQEDTLKPRLSVQSRHSSLQQDTVVSSEESLPSTKRFDQISHKRFSTHISPSHKDGTSSNIYEYKTELKPLPPRVDSLSDSYTTSSRTESSTYDTNKPFKNDLRSYLSKGTTASVLVRSENINEVTKLAQDSVEYISQQHTSSNMVNSSKRKGSLSREDQDRRITKTFESALELPTFQTENIKPGTQESQENAPQTVDSNKQHTSELSVSQKYAKQAISSGKNTHDTVSKTRFSKLSEAISSATDSLHDSQELLAIPDTVLQESRSYDQVVSHRHLDHLKSTVLESSDSISDNLILTQGPPVHISNSVSHSYAQQNVVSDSGSPKRASQSLRTQELTSQTSNSYSGAQTLATNTADSGSSSHEFTSQTLKLPFSPQKNSFGSASSSHVLDTHAFNLDSLSKNYATESTDTASNAHNLASHHVNAPFSSKTGGSSRVNPAQGTEKTTSRASTSSSRSQKQTLKNIRPISSSQESLANDVGSASRSYNHATDMTRSYSGVEKHTTQSIDYESSLQDQSMVIVSAADSQDHGSYIVGTVQSSQEHTTPSRRSDSGLHNDETKSGISITYSYNSGSRGHLPQTFVSVSTSETQNVPRLINSKQPYTKDMQTHSDKTNDIQEIPEKENSATISKSDPPSRPRCDKPHICTLQTTACCVPGELAVNLTSDRGSDDNFATGELEGVSLLFIRPTLQHIKYACAFGVLATVDFEKIDSSGCFGSLESPYCGRRMLKVKLELSHVKRSGWLFHIADSNVHSRFSNSSGVSHQLNEAEVQGFYPNITVYPSDKCPCIETLMQLIDGVASPAKTITFYISNQHIRIENDAGLTFKLSHRCLFALNGQHDMEGPNERVYIGLNRVVQDKTLSGYGVCSATISWACPWHN